MVKNKRAHMWAFPLGVILTVLAVVGAVSLVRLVVKGIKAELESPEEILAYETFLAKVILHDPDPFDDVGAVPMGNIPQLLDIGIWFILKDDEINASLPRDEADGSVLISTAMVEASYEKLFGAPPPKHADVEGSDFNYIYDAEAKLYRVPVGGFSDISLPRVVNVHKTGSAIELTVEYIAANDFALDESGLNLVKPAAAKTMLITLYARDDKAYPYRVGSISQLVVGDDALDLGGKPKLK